MISKIPAGRLIPTLQSIRVSLPSLPLCPPIEWTNSLMPPVQWGLRAEDLQSATMGSFAHLVFEGSALPLRLIFLLALHSTVQPRINRCLTLAFGRSCRYHMLVCTGRICLAAPRGRRRSPPRWLACRGRSTTTAYG